MKSPLISIIVSVYNAELYLLRCLESIFVQTLEDWELILVNDGSNDNSGRMCDKIALENPQFNIKVIHKSNGGVASARETGIVNANGIYSIHVDPDDWISPNALQILYNKAKETNADVVICDFLLDYGNNHKEISHQGSKANESYLMSMMTQERHGSLCNKLIRRELYQKFNLHFPKEMICWEDLFISCNIFMHDIVAEFIDKPLYIYDLHSNDNSMTRNASIQTLNAMKIFCDYFERYLDSNKTHWLYTAKSIVKLTAFRCNLLSESEIVYLYSEVNPWYISKYINSYNLPLYQALAMMLSGKSMRYSKKLFKVNSIYQRVKNKLKRYV